MLGLFSRAQTCVSRWTQPITQFRTMRIIIHEFLNTDKTMDKLERVFREENVDFLERRLRHFQSPKKLKGFQKEFVVKRVIRRAVKKELEYIKWKQQTGY